MTTPQAEFTRFLTIFILCFFVLSKTCNAYQAPANYWQEHGPAKIINHKKVFKNLNQFADFTIETTPKKALVIVTSNNQIKREAAQEIFQKNPKLQNIPVRFISVAAESKIAPQPLGITNAIQGAINRINGSKQAQIAAKYKQEDEAVFYCSIENFFTKPKVFEPRDHALVIIQTPTGQNFTYVSDGITIDAQIYDDALDKSGLARDRTGALATIGEELSSIYNIDSDNWQEFVTGHKMSRKQQILSAFKDEQWF